MKKNIFVLFFVTVSFFARSQSCDKMINYVKSKSYGTDYTSYDSSFISRVSFYSVTIEYQYRYFAIVCFKPNEYSTNCSEYIYEVGSSTSLNYSVNYLDSAGKAFWRYIHPYSDVLGCSPKFN